MTTKKLIILDEEEKRIIEAKARKMHISTNRYMVLASLFWDLKISEKKEETKNGTDKTEIC